MTLRKTICLLLVFFCAPAWGADVPVPVATDSRIKTFVYSENDVFSLVTHYGYQSNIEFGLHENVETISVGDRVGWQIVPAGRRLFVRAMTANARTNMTVVTNKHAYQFDLVSVPAPLTPNEELAYVVRFFYPDDKKNMLPPVPYSDDASFAASAPEGGLIYNYKYTYTGDEALAPIKVFDDGKATYFRFRSPALAPVIAAVGAGGRETAFSPRRSGDYWVVDSVSPKFTVRQGNAVVCVYNEKFSH